MSKTMFDDFNHLHSRSKTLRFELRPVDGQGEWLAAERCEQFTDALQGVIAEGDQRAGYYKQVKPIIDDYHRAYITERLGARVDAETGEPGLLHAVDPKTHKCFLHARDFKQAYEHYQTLRKRAKERTADQGAWKAAQKEWTETQKDLRKKLVRCFSDKKERLFGKSLIEETLPEWLERRGEWEENRACVEAFKGFTGYFTGFHTNRENMYSAEAQQTAITYRLMNENLPRFFNNCLAWERIHREHAALELSLAPEVLQDAGVDNPDQLFQPQYFIHLLTQVGIEKHNLLLGGKTTEDGHKLQGLNERINLYRQQHKIKPRALPNLLRLRKQILSEAESHSFIPQPFANDAELLDVLNAFIAKAQGKAGLIEKLGAALKHLADARLDGVYIKDSALAGLSTAMFENRRFIEDALAYHAETHIAPVAAGRKLTGKIEKAREAYCKQKVFSLAALDEALCGYISERAENDQEYALPDGVDKAAPVPGYFMAEAEKWMHPEQLQQAIATFKQACSSGKISGDRRAPTDEKDPGGEGYRQIQSIHAMLDAFMALHYLARPLYMVDKGEPIAVPDADLDFYADFNDVYEGYREWLLPLYNKSRNYLTKKPFATDKIKLNFYNYQLLKGWDKNKEPDYAGVLLRRDHKYFLAIMHTEHKNVFKDCPAPQGDEASYEKINYKQIPDAKQNFPRIFRSDTFRQQHGVPAEIDRLYENNEHKKGETFKKESLHTLIDFFKDSINKYEKDGYKWRDFGFRFSDTASYENINVFYDEVKQQAYKIWFTEIPVSHIEHCVREGQIFLFQIYNKDFSDHSRGQPNLHTLYWRAVFEAQNLSHVRIKLNGQAEVFYRQHSLDKTAVHKANTPVKRKTGQGESYFSYDIIKDRRYTQDKFFLHVPVTLNFKAPGQQATDFNKSVNRTIRNNPDVHIIGIDRGERHLLYYSVINRDGRIIDQDSLNIIQSGKDHQINYRQRLDDKEKARDQARKSWSTIENIKELKAGYLSQVVHQLAGLIIKHNAIVCLEDLNEGFKRGRFKIEKQVYQKFERALIEKLNYLVFKDTTSGQTGHYLQGYQLTVPFVSFENLGKQSGILYYVPAAYTSKVDPATGFINFLPDRYESLTKSKEFFEAMTSICYNPTVGYFELAFDYAALPVKKDLGQYQGKWTVCTHGDTRYYDKRDNGQWRSEKVNVTEELKKLFVGKDIDYRDGRDIRQAIAAAKDTKFYKTLYWLLRVTLALRYTKRGSEIDYILSPVKDKHGAFFDSRTATGKQPDNADANGAYHIALKGLWNLRRIDQWDGEGTLNLKLKDADWFAFLSKMAGR